MADEHWLPVRFRGDEVLARCDAAGGLIAGPGGLVEFCYKAGGKRYRSHADKFEAVAGATAAATVEPPRAAPAAARAPRTAVAARGGVRLVGMQERRPEAESVQLWTDGACSGNPGPAGLGVHAVIDGVTHEISEYLGTGTNNIAELTAMLRALELVADRTRPVDLMSDSEYGLKVVIGAYKAKKNVALIAEIQAVVATFGDLQLVKVPGHAGVDGNERADELARLAITRRASSRS